MSFDATERLKEQLLHQFQFSENIIKLIELIGDMFQDTLDVAEYLESLEDLDDYEGEQLEFWGELIGVKRPKAQETRIFMLFSPGETCDLDNDHGFKDDTDPDVTTGGYLTGPQGLESQSDPGSTMSDVDYRFLIRQKAASFRSKATRENLFNYLLAFGSRCVIDDDTTFEITYDPVTYYDLNAWEKYYVTTRGFKPSSVKIAFLKKMRNEDPI